MAEEGGITGLLGSSIGEAAAFAAGLAIAPVLEPYLQELRNLTWSGTPTRPLDPGDVADWLAEDEGRQDAAVAEAALTGLAKTPFLRLADIKVTAPGAGELLTLLRRSPEVAIDFQHGLRKAKLETQWDKAIENLRWMRIPAPDLAYMVVRGVVPDGGTLPGSLPTSSKTLDLPPQLKIDTLLEASLTGWDSQRFAALVARSGLAMAPVMAANAYFRGILDLDGYNMTIARGDLYPAFAGPVLEVARQILTAGQYAELQLRGYYDRDTRLKRTRLHGMSDQDSDDLYNVQGRSISVHQVTTGLARGGVFKGDSSQIPEAYLYTLQRGNLRPEDYSLAYANRYSLPTAFEIRALLTGGALTAPQGEELYLQIGRPPALAKKIADFFATSTTATADPHIKKAQTALETATKKSYIAGESDEATAKAALTAAGVPATSQDAVLTLWSHEAGLVRKTLTPAQIAKGFKNGDTNDATGAPWTEDEAVTALVDLGYSVTDARNLLNITVGK